MIDSAVSLALIGAGSPIAMAIVGFWLKRSGDVRTERLAALARQNLDKAQAIEHKVDGTATKATEDLAAANDAIRQLSVAFKDFQAKADRYYQTGTGGAALEHAIAQPIPTPDNKKS